MVESLKGFQKFLPVKIHAYHSVVAGTTFSIGSGKPSNNTACHIVQTKNVIDSHVATVICVRRFGFARKMEQQVDKFAFPHQFLDSNPIAPHFFVGIYTNDYMVPAACAEKIILVKS